MAKFQVTDLFKAVGLAAGGKTATTQAAGAIYKLQASVNEYAGRLGAKIGDYTGGALFKSLAAGAESKDRAETAAMLENETGVDINKIATYGLLAAAGVAAWLVMRD